MLYHLIALSLLSLRADHHGHDVNAVLKATVSEGLAVGEVRVKLQEPRFRDGQTAEQQHTALAEIAGTSRGADEMLQASLSAPHKLQTADVKAEGTILRTADLYFVVRGVNLDAIKPETVLIRPGVEKMEAANIRFEVRELKPEDLKELAQVPASDHSRLVHSKGRILDRIAVESTNLVDVSRSEDSLIFASKTDPRFGPARDFPNRWSTIALKSTGDVFGPAQPYAGSIGYVKITRLKAFEKALVVEVHLAFAEPLSWFDGAPILRSKFGLIAQDQVRRLRRELSKEAR